LFPPFTRGARGVASVALFNEIDITELKGELGEKNFLAELDFIRFRGSAIIYPPFKAARTTLISCSASAGERHSIRFPHTWAKRCSHPIDSSFESFFSYSRSIRRSKHFGELCPEAPAVAAINGGFFDPVNQKSTSIVVVEGVLVADPNQNERLIDNPKLAPYLKKILNRTEFRRYLCGQTIRYDISLHTEPPLPGCRLVDVLGGGPRLLPELSSLQEGFLDFSNGEVIRDPLGSSQPNARSAVGITRDGSVLWMMVAQKPEAPTTSGMSLQALAAFMKTKGVEEAMNLDGGSSSSFYYKGKTFYGKVNAKGQSDQAVSQVCFTHSRNE
jgi:hypothetical protein